MNLPIKTTPPRNILETSLVMLSLFALLIALYDVLKVFFGVFTFSLIFFISFAPLFERLTVWTKRRKLAAVIYSVVLITVVALPFVFMISAMLHHVKEAAHWVGHAKENGVPPLPEWASRIPLFGDEISGYWQQLQAKPRETIVVYESQLKDVLHHLLHAGAGLLGAAFEFITGIIISAFLLVHRRAITHTVGSVLKHLLGEEYADSLLKVSAQAVRGVAIGVMGTAFIAAFISWIGFMIAGIPFKLGLSVLVFFLVVIQVGPLPVWLGVAIWMFTQGNTGWGIFVSVYALVVLVADSVLKPVLIAKSGKLPFLVLFLGTIGGIAAWGFTGMFKGAIILAVFYTVFNAWLAHRNKQVRAESVQHGII